MSIALSNRISALERQMAEILELVKNGESADLQKEKPANKFGPRQLCPKCHEKPNHYLHVKHCRGTK